MPEIKTRLQEGADDIKLNVPYMINDVEEVVTERQGYEGHRVELLDIKGNLGSVMLWSRSVTSPKSKLGVFLTLLGANTDRWLKKWIVFRGWEQNNRNIELVEAPVAKEAKAAPAKATPKAAKGA